MSKPPPIEDELRALSGTTPPPPPGFTAAVMHRVALRGKPRPRGFWQALLAPRTITIRFRLSHLMGAGAIAAGLLIAALRIGPHPTAPIQHVSASASDQAPAAPVYVRFALSARAARTVSVAGDFNGWRPDATPLVRNADGLWTITIPLAAGSWSYSFVVDGQWVEDPLAESYRADGFGGRNALVRVGG
jgi:hypothetical protein